jgi:hypothetical protein
MSDLLQSGIQLFNNGEFFHCHEVLEEAWAPERGPMRLFLQSLIHLAVGLYHWQRGNRLGAASQLRKGLGKLAAYLPAYEGVDTARLYRDAGLALEHVKTGVGQLEYPRIHVESGTG